MNEHLGSNQHGETLHGYEVKPTPEKQASVEEKQTQNNEAESLKSIRDKIEQQAVSKENFRVDKSNEQQPQSFAHYITKQIKAQRYQLTLNQVRRHLKPSQQRFSRIIHQPMIETTSEFGSKTIARPSGLIGGGLLALLGNLTIVIIARHVGFSLPNSLFAVLFAVGFVIGIIIELIARRFKRTI